MLFRAEKRRRIVSRADDPLALPEDLDADIGVDQDHSRNSRPGVRAA
jgi:hypothetical protein